MKRKDRTKRCLSMLLSIVMTISFFANGSIAYASDEQPSDNTTDYVALQAEDSGNGESSEAEQQEPFITESPDAGASENDPPEPDTAESEDPKNTDQDPVEETPEVTPSTSETPVETGSSTEEDKSADAQEGNTTDDTDDETTADPEGDEVVAPVKDADGITVRIDEADASKATIFIRGTVSWDDIAAKLASNGTFTAVSITGQAETVTNDESLPMATLEMDTDETDSPAVITFSTDSSTLKCSLDYAVTFDELTLSTVGNYGLWLFANGHPFETTNSVTTSGTISVFGGGNECSADSTDIKIYGGNFDLISGGSYSNSTATEVSVLGSTNVVIGPSASAVSVVGGCIGGVNYGNISVTYYADSVKRNNVIIGSSADAALENTSERGLSRSMAKVVNPGGSISVNVVGGSGSTYVGSLLGVADSNVDLGSGTVSVTVDSGVVYQGFYGAYGGGAFMPAKNAHIYPGSEYYLDEVGQILYYAVTANFDIQLNGNCSTGLMVQGCHAVEITGDIAMVVNGSAYAVCGGVFYCGVVKGNIDLTVGGTIQTWISGGGFLEGNYYNLDYYRAVQRGLLTREPSANVTGNITVTLTGTTYDLYGGSLNYSAAATTIGGNVTVKLDGGTVTDNIYVGSSNYYGGTNLIGGSAALQTCGNSTVAGSIYGAFNDNKNFGSSDTTGGTNTITGDVSILIGGSTVVSGAVYGSGFDYLGTILDQGSVTVQVTGNAAVNGTIYTGGYCCTVKGDTNTEIRDNASVIVSNASDAIFGGGNRSDISGNSSILITDQAKIQGNVWGGGYIGSIGKNTTIELSGNAIVDASSDVGIIASGRGNDPSTSATGGSATIYVKDNAQLNGYFFGDFGNCYGSSIVTGDTSVIFDHCTGSYLGIAFTDLVQVTDDSDVTIDDTTESEDARDDAQFYNVTDLTVDQGSRLTLPSSASISGNFTGDTAYISGSDTDNRGTLILTAGKRLETGGSVSGWTKLSILNDDATDTKPEAGQVYVISDAGSTLDNGGFAWVDQRNRLTLDWQAAEETNASQWYLVPLTGSVTITPVSITAYEGGTSLNGNHIPKLRFSVNTSEDLDYNVNDLSFTLYTVNGETGEVTEAHLERSRIDNSGEVTDTYCLFPLLDEDLGNIDSDGTLDQLGTYLKLVDTSGNDASYAGVYVIQTTGEYGTDWYITASVTADGCTITYPVEFVTDPAATVTIRKVADETAMYESPDTLLTQVVTDQDELGTTSDPVRRAYALFPKKTEFLTNGSAELGLLGAGEYSLNDSPNEMIALLFDESTTLTSERSVEELQEMMLDYAEAKTGTSYDGWKTEFRYLDLVNANDGNILITADQTATIYWPYPDGITYETAGNYQFQVLHYSGMERENSIDLGTSLEDAGVTVETCSVTPTEYGLEFETSSFSPYVLLWQIKTVTLTLVYDPLWQWIGGDNPDVTITMDAGTVVDMTTLVIPGHENDDPVSWYTESGDPDTVITKPFAMTADKTIYAGTALGGGGDEETPSTGTVTLTLVYDPLWQWIGGDNPDVTITMNAGTVVDMTTLVIPGHENDDPVSWYTESGDPDTVITKPFAMTADKTIYAGTAISGGNGETSNSGTAFYLSFNSNGGSYIPPRKFTTPTNVDFDDPAYIPTRDGYTFTGWYVDFALTERLTGIYNISTDMTVCAGWELTNEKDVTLTTGITVALTLVYDPTWQITGNGTPDVIIEMEVDTVVDMTTLVIPGHTEDGSISWYEEAGNPDTLITAPFAMIENKTIYADTDVSGGSIIEEEPPAIITAFYLTYQSNGGSYIPARMFTEPTDVDFEDPNYVPTREGYTFTGWYTDFTLRDQLTGVHRISSDMTVWAGWELDGTADEPVLKTETVTLTLVYDPTGKGISDVSIEMPVGTVVDMTSLEIPGHETDDPISWTERLGDVSTIVTKPFTMTTDKTIYAWTATTADGIEESPEVTPTPSEQVPVVTPEVTPTPSEQVPVVTPEATPTPSEQVPVVTPEVTPAPSEQVPVVTPEVTPAPSEQVPVVTPEVTPAPSEQVPVVTPEVTPTPSEQVPVVTPEVTPTPSEQVPVVTPEVTPTPSDKLPEETLEVSPDPSEQLPEETPEVTPDDSSSEEKKDATPVVTTTPTTPTSSGTTSSTTTTTSTNTSSKSVPTTGDETPLVLLLCTMLISGLGLTVVVASRKKRKDKQ